MSRRYRFSYTVKSDQTGYFADEWSETIDAAIARAKELAVSRSNRIHVTDTAAIPYAVRGVADGRRWTWMVPCRACKGAGKVTVTTQNPNAVGSAKATKPKQEDCARYSGIGVVADPMGAR